MRDLSKKTQDNALTPAGQVYISQGVDSIFGFRVTADWFINPVPLSLS